MAASSLYNCEVTRISDDGILPKDVGCPVCRTPSPERRFAISGLDAELVRCRSCELGWLQPQPSADQLARFYPPEYYGSTGQKFASWIEWAVRFVGGRHVRFLARRVPQGGRILDVGCGRGVLLRELVDRGFEAHGFEVSQAAADGVDPRVAMRIGDDLASAGYPERSFDQVIVWHVLEHVPRPRDLLEEIHRIMKPGGEIVVAVPNFSSLQARWSGPAWFHLDPPRHLFHFSMAGLRQLLAETGFRVDSVHHFSLRQNPFGWVQSGLNKLPGVPRNGLYELLHCRQQGAPSRFDWVTRQILLAAFAFGMPAGLALEVFATAFRSGATVHMVAKAEQTT